MVQEIHKFLKYMFLATGFITISFSIAFFFLWEWFFRGIQQWPFDDPGMPLIFGGAVLSFSFMAFWSFFQKDWTAVKTPLYTILVWAFSGVGIMLFIQFTMPVDPWNWFNTLSYLIVGLLLVVALILQLRKNKSE